jgi:hypothetical protein
LLGDVAEVAEEISRIAKRIKGLRSGALITCRRHRATMGQWGMAGKWWRSISGQKGYEKADTVSVIDEEKEKLRAHKTREKHQK